MTIQEGIKATELEPGVQPKNPAQPIYKRPIAWVTAGVLILTGGIATNVAFSTPGSIEAWTDKNFGTFETASYSGDGRTGGSIPMPEGAKVAILTISGAKKVTASFQPPDIGEEGDFYIGLLETNGHTTSALVMAESPSGQSERILISASDAWRATIEPVSSAPEFPLSGSGHDGDRIYLWDAPRKEFISSASYGMFTLATYTGVAGKSVTSVTLGNFAPVDNFTPAPGYNVVIVGSVSSWSVKEK